MQEENNVALLFTSDGGATLNGLLEDESTTLTAATTEEEEESLSVMRCPEMEGLVKKAMRKRNDEEESEERWVSYSEVVEEKKEMMEEVNSCVVGIETMSFFGSLSLKLDHDGILNAWSDKGSLYVVDGCDESPQTVPDLFNASSIFPNGYGYGGDVNANTWKVPDGVGASNNNVKVKEEMGWKLGQREASLLRYKEKRQSRLFAKRIRYEVRKLNAEKRPRMKGRFVKRE
ncbi:CCT motif family protein [Trifolium repens]|nr:CCT motif family protein [Trifolium repens]